tara:strand:- start:2729 stop:2968 length:240 start_codon:yes stop_codon:yes gene_type:complete
MASSTPSLPQSNSKNYSASVISEYGKQNMFPIETPIEMDSNYSNYPEEAEKTNGRWAMIGFAALLGAYISSGQIIPGIF